MPGADTEGRDVARRRALHRSGLADATTEGRDYWDATTEGRDYWDATTEGRDYWVTLKP